MIGMVRHGARARTSKCLGKRTRGFIPVLEKIGLGLAGLLKRFDLRDFLNSIYTLSMTTHGRCFVLWYEMTTVGNINRSLALCCCVCMFETVLSRLCVERYLSIFLTKIELVIKSA